MSLDLNLYTPDDDEIASINTQRNPFGLLQWAEDNYAHAEGPWGSYSLNYVCNHWAYDESKNVNRYLFRETVYRYSFILLNLDQSYFFFDLPAYRQFINGKDALFPGSPSPAGENQFIDGAFYHHGKLAIPVEHFKHPHFHLTPGVATPYYQKWFGDLIHFADLLQNPELRFECSN